MKNIDDILQQISENITNNDDFKKLSEKMLVEYVHRKMLEHTKTFNTIINHLREKKFTETKKNEFRDDYCIFYGDNKQNVDYFVLETPYENYLIMRQYQCVFRVHKLKHLEHLEYESLEYFKDKMQNDILIGTYPYPEELIKVITDTSNTHHSVMFSRNDIHKYFDINNFIQRIEYCHEDMFKLTF